MSKSFFKVKKGLNVDPVSAASISDPEVGDIIVDSSDNNKLKRYDNVTASWKDVGSGVGGINYISTNSDFEGGVTGYARYANTVASVSPETGTGGSPNANFTFTAITSTPLRGTKSGLITKDAAIRQGHGVSYDFTIDSADQAQILRISFDYLTSTNYADGYIRLYVYDVTNSRLIEVVDRDLYASSFGKYTGTFQTSPDSTSYRLIFHVADAAALAWTVKIDNVIVGPQTIVKGAIVTDPVSTTVTSLFKAFTTNPTFGTITFDDLSYSREGKYLFIQGGILQTTAGTAGISTYYVELPDGLAADNAFISNAGSTGMGTVGSATIRASGVLFNGSAAIRTTSPSQLLFTFGNDTNATALLSSTFLPTTNADWRFSFTAKIPILGWSSNMVLSEDAGNREIATLAYKATDATGVAPNNSWVKLTLDTVSFDTSSAFNSSLSRIEIPETGYYDINAKVRFTGTNVLANRYRIAVSKNGSLEYPSQEMNATVGIQFTLNLSELAFLQKGDYLELQIFGAGNNSVSTLTIGGGTNTVLSIAKRSSPQTIAASEVVACAYSTNAGQSIPSGSSNGIVILFEDQSYDTHSSYNTSTGIFTAPQSGWYSCSASCRYFQDMVATSTVVSIGILKNGNPLIYHSDAAKVTGSVRHGRSITHTVYLSKGDYLEIVTGQNSGVPKSLETISSVNAMSIIKINGVP